MKTLMSVLMPTYNVESYVEDALKSLESQNFSKDSFEVVMVDDGSTDSTLSRVEDYMSKSGINLRMFNNDINHNQAFSRNRAAENARGDYFLIFDSDDLLDESCLRRLYEEFVNNKGVGFIYSDHAAIGPNTRFPPKKEDFIYLKHNKPSFDLCSYLENGKNYVAHAKCVRREDYVPFDESLPYSEDADFIINVALNGSEFHRLPEVLYYWRRGVDSTTSRSPEDLRDYYSGMVFERGMKKFYQKE